MTASARPPIAYGSRAWFDLVGATSLTLGAARFHAARLERVGALIDHSARWVIRFSDVALPEVMSTHGVPSDVVEHYNSSCASIDPFAAHWRLHLETGVRALSRFEGAVGSVDPYPYNQAFKPAANVTDEMGLFVSTIGRSSLGLFLERETGEFTDEELEIARLAFPTVDGLHRAHIGRLFERVQRGDSASPAFLDGSVLVQDRHGVEIHSTAAWRSAAQADPRILDAVQAMAGEGAECLDDGILTCDVLDRYFPLAPEGRLFALTPYSADPEERTAATERASLLARLNPREREVFNLILAGGSTSSISKVLSLAKGTVKNYKLAIYRASGLTSERALIQKYGVRG